MGEEEEEEEEEQEEAEEEEGVERNEARIHYFARLTARGFLSRHNVKSMRIQQQKDRVGHFLIRPRRAAPSAFSYLHRWVNYGRAMPSSFDGASATKGTLIRIVYARLRIRTLPLDALERLFR